MISYRNADLFQRKRFNEEKTLVFEKGYLIHNGRESATYTYDCSNGTIINAPMVPPIKGTVMTEGENDGKIVSAEYTNFLQQLWAWDFEVVSIDYGEENDQQIRITVKKK
jgi:hypothetical protein